MSHFSVRGSEGVEISPAQRLLLETLTGHLALLASTHPRKAASATARRAKRCVAARLRSCGMRHRIAA